MQGKVTVHYKLNRCFNSICGILKNNRKNLVAISWYQRKKPLCFKLNRAAFEIRMISYFLLRSMDFHRPLAYILIEKKMQDKSHTATSSLPIEDPYFFLFLSSAKHL